MADANNNNNRLINTLQQMNGKTITDKNGRPYTVEIVPPRGLIAKLAAPNRFTVLVNAPAPLNSPEWKIGFSLGPLHYKYGEKFGKTETVGIFFITNFKTEWGIDIVDFNPVRGNGLFPAAIKLLRQFTPEGQMFSLNDIKEETTATALEEGKDFFKTPLGKAFSIGLWRLVENDDCGYVTLETTGPATYDCAEAMKNKR